jgi:hypothetical protein
MLPVDVVEYSIAGNFKAIRRIFGAAGAGNWWRPRYNVAPTQLAPVVRIRDGQRELVELRWGLIPFWAKDRKIAYKTINARAETVATARPRRLRCWRRWRMPTQSRNCRCIARLSRAWLSGLSEVLAPSARAGGVLLQGQNMHILCEAGREQIRCRPFSM